MDKKHITFADMVKYIAENHPEDKAWFKSIALNNGKYNNHLKVVKEFKNHYPDEFKTEKKKKADLLADW